MPTLEDVIHYWDARPCNIRHSNYPLDSLQYSREVTRRKYFVEPHIPKFADFERWSGGERVLDVGCGIGTDAIQFAWRGCRVVGLDLSARSIAIARRRSFVEGADRAWQINFELGNAEASCTWIGGQPFDLIYSFGALHHTPHPEIALRNLADILKPAGQLRIMLYHRWSTKAIGIYISHVLKTWTATWLPEDPKDFDDAVAERSEAEPGCPITHTYSRKSAKAMLQGAGFWVQQMYVEHIFPYDGKKYGQGVYVKKWYWKMCPVWLFRKLERTLGWHLCIIAELK